MIIWLQWGHGESAVENGKSKPKVIEEETLQWGHGESAVENSSRLARLNSQQSSFNGATANPPWKTPGAAGGLFIAGRLQWGHGESAVENFDVFVVSRNRSASLQ